MNNNNESFFVNSEEDLPLQLPFINVEKLKNVKQKDVPTTAEEFLLSVIAERRNIVEVTRCDVDYTQFNRNQSLFFDEELLPPVPDNLRPTKEWQNIQVADFSEVRSYVSRMQKQKPREMKKIRKFHVSKDDLNWWRNFFSLHEPTLSCVLGFNGAQVDQGLEKLIELLEKINPGETVDRQTGRWIYALLICLKHPLHSDTISIIRNLARRCATVRSLIDPECENAKELAAPLNLIICIVGHYYRQLDLADSLK